MAEEVGIGWKVSELLICVNDSGSSLRKPVQYADDTQLSVFSGKSKSFMKANAKEDLLHHKHNLPIGK